MQRGGIDARSPAEINTQRIGYTLSIYFSVATTQICYIFAKEEVINTLIAEYDYAADIAVQRAEEREIAFAEGIEQGIVVNGSRQAKLETAKNLLDIGLSVESILKAISLRSEEIATL